MLPRPSVSPDAVDVTCKICDSYVGPAPHRLMAVMVFTDHYRDRHLVPDPDPELPFTVVGMTEGEDWECEPAVLRCEVCYIPVEFPVWTHILTVSRENGTAHLPETIWILCNSCHGFCVQKDVLGWVTHWLERRRDIRKDCNVGGVTEQRDIFLEVYLAAFRYFDEGTKVK